MGMSSKRIAGTLAGALVLGFLAFDSRAVQWQLRPMFMGMQTYSDNISLAPSGSVPGAPPRQSAFVTTLAPGLMLNHNGRWMLHLNYQMQNLLYAGQQSGASIYNQMQLSSFGPVVEDSVYLGLFSNVGQAIIGSAANRSTPYQVDNLARTGNTTNFYSATIAPSWRPHFSGYVDGIVGMSFTHTGTGLDRSTQDGFSGASFLTEYANIYSGDQFNLIGWRANLFNTSYLATQNNPQQGSGANPSFLNYNGQIQYRLSEKIQPFIQGGAFDNSVAGPGFTTASLVNGSYWNTGLIWTPSRRLFLQGGIGQSYRDQAQPGTDPTQIDYFLTFRSTPTKRTEIAFTYRQSGVGGAYGYGGFGGTGYGQGLAAGVFGGGLGAGGGMGNYMGGPGSQGLYRAGMSGACNAGFGAGAGGLTMGGMGAIGGLGGIGGIGGFGLGGAAAASFGVNQLGGFNAGNTFNAALCHRTHRTFWEATYAEYVTTMAEVLANQAIFLQNNQNNFNFNQPNFIAIDQPNLVSINNVITRKGGQASVNYKYSKNIFTLRGYQESRDYQQTGKQSLVGFNAIWSWQFNLKTASVLSFAWQSLDNMFTGQPQYTDDFRLVQFGVYRRFMENLFGGLTYRYSDQTSGDALNTYQENRVYMNVFMTF